VPMRRAGDHVPRLIRWKDRSAAAALLAGFSGFLYQLQVMLREHTSAAWDYYGTPVGVGEVIFCFFWGVLAMGGALGLNIGTLIRGFVTQDQGRK
jgi:hypothetical protein